MLAAGGQTCRSDPAVNLRIQAAFVELLNISRNDENLLAGINVARQLGQIRKSNAFISMRTGSDLVQKGQGIAVKLLPLRCLSGLLPCEALPLQIPCIDAPFLL